MEARAALPGTLLGAKGTAFDLPHVIEAAAGEAKRFDLGDRLTLASGDFFAAVPQGGDVYLLSMILHDWDDEHAARILTVIREAAPSGARVLSLELVVPPGDTPHMAKMIDRTMLGMLTGRERTEDQLRDLFTPAGLRFERALPTPTPMTVIEATVA